MSLPVPAELNPTPRDGLVAPTSSNLAGAPADRREGRVTAGSRLPGSVRPMTTRYDSASPRLVAPSPPNAAYRFVTIQVAGILSFVVLKILAFQDRHQNKDAYDLVYSMLYFEGGPEGAAGAASASGPSRI